MRGPLTVMILLVDSNLRYRRCGFHTARTLEIVRYAECYEFASNICDGVAIGLRMVEREDHMKQAINSQVSNSLWQYLLCLTITSVPFWIIGGWVETTALPINLPVSALMVANPMLVAMVLIYREQGIVAVRALLKRTLDQHRIQHKIWYLPVFLLMPLLMVLAYSLMVLTGNGLSNPEVPLLMAPVMFLVFFVAAIGEELGWQGYAYERLHQHWNALQTSIVLGILWAIWHIIPYIQTQNTLTWVVWQCVATVGLRVLIVWLYNNTGQSMFTAIAFHAMINVSNFLFPNYGSHYDPFFASIAIWAVVAVVSIKWGAELSPNEHK